MAVLLALASALIYGAGDFFGGLTARRIPPFLVVLVSHAIVVIPMLVMAALIGAERFDQTDLAWSLAGAIGGALGVALLYRALAAGPMSVVSPITALVAAVLPVIVGSVFDEAPSVAQAIGIVLAFGAIVLVSRGDTSGETDQVAVSTMLAAGAAGVGFGVFFIALAQTGDESGLWPIAVGRVASAALFALVLFATPRTWRVPRFSARQWRGDPVAFVFVLLAAAGDLAANVLYLIAVRKGDLAIVSVLSSLYPASTVVLARVALREQMVPSQLIGLACAVGAVGLVAAG